MEETTEGRMGYVLYHVDRKLYVTLCIVFTTRYTADFFLEFPRVLPVGHEGILLSVPR